MDVVIGPLLAEPSNVAISEPKKSTDLTSVRVSTGVSCGFPDYGGLGFIERVGDVTEAIV